ncbi:alpha/beta hydrolase-fold protein [Streptomyces sp. NPDC005811]|uniref:extracellular catalytic domain type 1 short-chain-length polyhydroxyalkanoate depolymerase n=1 Tax=Streptomyces sp. NPDC005811 TaxID=3154565 RepID=UPI0034035165
MQRPQLVRTALALACGLLLAAPAQPAAASGTPYEETNSPGGSARCALPAGRTTLTLLSDGRERTVLVYLPRRSQGRGHLPTVLNLHGSQSTAAEQLDRSGLERTADREGFLVVAPQGALDAAPGYRWNVPYVTAPGGPDDERFLDDTVDALTRNGCTDARKMYATGYSGGARMVSQYACDRPDRLAAVAAVAGLRAGAPMQDADGTFAPDPDTCQPGRGVPVLSFSGTADPVNPYHGGGAAYWGYGAEAAERRWAALDGCRQAPRTTTVTAHVTRRTYGACRGGDDVVSYVVDGGGHTWPGSTAEWPAALGGVTQEIDAGRIMWDFFRRA